MMNEHSPSGNGAGPDIPPVGGWRVPRPIVIVGLMGAGKSAIGRRLAVGLGVEFFDADAEIEKAAGMSIHDIFKLRGEAEFRIGERKVIARLLKRRPHVLATGGGAYMNAETRNQVRRKGVSVWLKADLETLVQRTSKRDNRPLLRNGDPAKILADLIEARYPVYAEADLAIETGNGPHEVVLSQVIDRLAAHGAIIPAAPGAEARGPGGKEGRT